MQNPYSSSVMAHSKLNFKISTKEKMYVIKLEEPRLAENMAASLTELVMPYLEAPVKNLILDFSETKSIDSAFVEEMARIQRTFYEQNASMVFCCFSGEVMQFLKEKDFLDELNYTPTESEAWDIVQMDEIERELLKG